MPGPVPVDRSVSWRLRFLDDHLQRWADCRFHQMTAFRLTTAHSNNDMQMQAGPSLFIQRAIAEQAEHFALFVDLDPVIVLPFKVEKSQRRLLESADPGQRGRSEGLFADKTFKRCNHGFFGGQHDDESALAFTFSSTLNCISCLLFLGFGNATNSEAKGFSSLQPKRHRICWRFFRRPILILHRPNALHQSRGFPFRPAIGVPGIAFQFVAVTNKNHSPF